jgi:hypothetical protein
MHIRPPIPPREAWGYVEYWLGCTPVWIPQPSDNHRTVLRKVYDLIAPEGNLVPDAHLAALSIEHGLTLGSTDWNCAGFPELKWDNPLQKSM